MSIRSVIARWATRAAAVAAFAWGTSAPAADVAVPPPPVAAAAPVAVGEAPGCASCQSCEHGAGAAPKGRCSSCGKLFHKERPPFPVTLCPGSCFGYFQTQWRKWDEVCPYPYLGTGVSDAMRTPGAAPPRPAPSGSELTPPRPVDPSAPKMIDPKKLGSNTPLYPSVPLAPVTAPSKFAP
jgi:hypothetical protein